MKLRYMLCQFVFSSAVLAANAEASILPPNSFAKELNPLVNLGLSETEYNEAISYFESVYVPIVRAHGANLRIDRLWGSSDVNAYAKTSGSDWIIEAHGALARRYELTPDAYTLVLCHELGHHIGGYPFKTWASSEGAADYFAATTCARTLWRRQVDVNRSFRDHIQPTAKASCDRRWSTVAEQNLCYRTMTASYALVDFLAGGTDISFDRKESEVVSSTYHDHPKGQCRLDTYSAGAICRKSVDSRAIPGKGLGNTLEAERATVSQSCTQYDFDSEGFRPLCWFKPLLRIPSTLAEFHGGCGYPNAQSNECHAAIQNYLVKKGLGNAGVAQELGANVYGVAAVQADFYGDVSVATLKGYQPGCSFPNAQSNECVSAVRRFCNAKGYGMGLTQQIGNQVFGVACFHSAWYGDVPMSELRGQHSGCNFPNARSNECVSAIHRACNQRGFAAGLAQEIGNQVYGVGCFNTSWYGNITVNY